MVTEKNHLITCILNCVVILLAVYQISLVVSQIGNHICQVLTIFLNTFFESGTVFLSSLVYTHINT